MTWFFQDAAPSRSAVLGAQLSPGELSPFRAQGALLPGRGAGRSLPPEEGICAFRGSQGTRSYVGHRARGSLRPIRSAADETAGCHTDAFQGNMPQFA